MDTDREIARLVGDIKRLADRVRWLKKHRALLDQCPEGSMCGGISVDFDKLPHKEVIRVIRTLGGKWAKSVNHYAGGGDKPTIDYTTRIDGVEVRCWGGEPPPTCRLVEVEEDVPEKVIPAHKKKVLKMVCTGQSDPLAVAMARAVNPVGK